MLSNEFRDKDKDSKVKKMHNLLSANQGNSGSRSHIDQALGQLKKDFCPDHKDQQGQFFNTSTTGSNATIVKKTKNKMIRT